MECCLPVYRASDCTINLPACSGQDQDPASETIAVSPPKRPTLPSQPLAACEAGARLIYLIRVVIQSCLSNGTDRKAHFRSFLHHLPEATSSTVVAVCVMSPFILLLYSIVNSYKLFFVIAFSHFSISKATNMEISSSRKVCMGCKHCWDGFHVLPGFSCFCFTTDTTLLSTFFTFPCLLFFLCFLLCTIVDSLHLLLVEE